MRIVVESRIETPKFMVYLVPIFSVGLALVFGGILMAVVGADPIATYRAMAEGAFGSVEQWRAGQYYSITETLVKAIPLMLTSLAVGVAFRMLFWNIGAEGQLVLGGVSASAVALWLGDLIPGVPESQWIYLPLMAGAGIIAGGVWAVIPAILKAYLKVNEIITTLMLNYVAILWYQYLVNVAWKDPDGYGFPGSAKFGECCKIARISGRLHWGLGVAFVCAILMWII
ncbi:MAG TPA: ABC transporter permease, partial [Anaerolineales bacterium]|nr:ABC transporter permease [Anaerolineales bacterium]